jgi:hypothetical protein
MNIRRLNLFAFLIVISLITFRHIKGCKELPWPPQYIYTALVFGLVDITSFFSEEIAGVTSIGLVLAVAVCTFGPEGTCNLKLLTNCEHGGTGQPQTTAYLGSSQPPSTASLQEYQQQTGPVLPGAQPGGTILA